MVCVRFELRGANGNTPPQVFTLGQALAGAVWHLMVAARGTKKPFPGRIPFFESI